MAQPDRSGLTNPYAPPPAAVAARPRTGLARAAVLAGVGGAATLGLAGPGTGSAWADQGTAAPVSRYDDALSCLRLDEPVTHGATPRLRDPVMHGATPGWRLPALQAAPRRGTELSVLPQRRCGVPPAWWRQPVGLPAYPAPADPAPEPVVPRPIAGPPAEPGEPELPPVDPGPEEPVSPVDPGPEEPVLPPADPRPGKPALPADPGPGKPVVTPGDPVEGARLVSVDGTVEAGVEPGCKVLRGADGAVWTLVGPLSTLPLGVSLTVAGVTQPDLLSTCQQGAVLRVRQVALPDGEPGPTVPIATTHRITAEARPIPVSRVYPPVDPACGPTGRIPTKTLCTR